MSVLGQRIDCKRLPIDALPGVQRATLVVDHPVKSAEFLVPEVAAQILIGPPGCDEIRGVFVHAECLGKRPENSSVQDKPLGCVGVNGQVVGDLPAKSAVLLIDGVFEPEGQNVGS